MNDCCLDSGNSLSFQGNIHPEVSILIPYYNRPDLTGACLDSLLKNTLGIPYEIILVDDASNETLNLFDHTPPPPIHTIRNEVRKNFSINNNQAAARARGEFLCLLNNDTLLTPGWLKPMVDILRRHPNIGVLGNKHLFPKTETLHHCGMAFDNKDLPWHLHPHTDPTLPAVNYQRDFQIVTFACVMIPASVYRELGGLDESFHNGFEDCDFCLRARKAGYRITYTPASTIYHYGQSSPGRQTTDEDNKKLFLAKWEGKIEPDFQRITQEDRKYNRKQLRRPRYRPALEPGVHLAVDLGQANAFTWVCAELTLALFHLGEKISIPHCRLHSSIEPHQAKILRTLMGKPNKIFQVKWTHYWPRYLKQTLNGEVNAEIFSTNYRYRPEGRSLDFWMRHVLVNGYRKLPVSSFCREALLEIGLSASECTIVPHAYSPEIDLLYPEGCPQRSSSDLHLLVVTNSHDLYRYGTDILIPALGKAFTEKDPVIVHIKDYGSDQGKNQIQEWVDAQPRFPRIFWHREFLTKDELIRLYADMDALIAPFRGEGFAMKILDAMALGLPVLIPSFGGPTEFIQEGTFLPLPYKEVEVEECLDRRHYYLGKGAYWCEVEFSGLLETLLSLPDRREELQKVGSEARNYVHGQYTWEKAAQKLMQALRSWEQERLGRVSIRRGPGRLPLSVIIPTREREDTLGQALEGYQNQSLPADQFEIILINDHGPKEKLNSLLEAHPVSFPVRVLENEGLEGPAAARNLGIYQAKGEVVLITGDDILPDPRFLEEHLEGHKRFPHLESALVGRTVWHPDLEITPFMEIITGHGGEQFDYEGAKHNREVSFGHFYTSNVSLKRDFLIEEEELFSTHYRYAAHEDTELAYRLHLSGMVLRYIETAKGYHHHAMSLRSFVERQKKVGRMLALLAVQRPSYVPNEHAVFLKALEFVRNSNTQKEIINTKPGWSEEILEGLVTAYDRALSSRMGLGIPHNRDILDKDAAQWRQWLLNNERTIWKTLNELILRYGMAEEWADNEDEARWAKDWVVLLTLPKIFGPTRSYFQLPVNRLGLDEGLALSGFKHWAVTSAKKIPFIETMYRKMINSQLGWMLRNGLTKWLQR